MRFTLGLPVVALVMAAGIAVAGIAAVNVPEAEARQRSCSIPSTESEKLLGATVVDSYVKPKGAFINVVFPAGSAAIAGLLSGDIIISADGKPVTSAAALLRLLRRRRPGDTVHVKAVHLGTLGRFSIVLGGTRAAVAAPVLPAQNRAPAENRTAQTRPNATAETPTPHLAAVRWARYTDPAEHAFTINVPAGWHVSGGSRRISAIEIRSGIDAVSPDGAIHLFYGDLNTPSYTVPSIMLARSGLRPGMIYNAGHGQQFVIMPYMTGQTFAARWGASRMARNCSAVKLTRMHPRPDVKRGMNMADSAAASANGIHVSDSPGEANFTCNMGGAPAVGYVFADTRLFQSQISSLWNANVLAGFIAKAPQANEAYALLSHMVASLSINPDWTARQQQITAQFNNSVQQTNRMVSNAIIENGRIQTQTSEMIFKGGQQRANATFNAVNNYDKEVVQGKSTYINPETGDTYDLNNSKTYHYVTNQGKTIGTDREIPAGERLDLHLHKLKHISPSD